MSRKKLGQDIEDRINAYFDKRFPPGRKEQLLARYRDTNDKCLFVKKLNELFDRIENDDVLRQEYFHPLYQFYYDECERRYLSGDSMALMECIDFCAEKKVALPEWAAEAFRSNLLKIKNYEARSWDDVFGKPHKGVHIKEKRLNQDRLMIYDSVKKLVDQGCKAEVAFSEVGKRFGSKGREISGIYRDLERQRVKRLEGLFKGMVIADEAISAVLRVKKLKPK